jgi:hypothetical protein
VMTASEALIASYPLLVLGLLRSTVSGNECRLQ